jgi:hypothetical protein
MNERCPACGDTTDYCVGHTGDRRSVRVLVNHNKGRHHACSPTGCDEAFDAAIGRIIEAQRIGVGLS